MIIFGIRKHVHLHVIVSKQKTRRTSRKLWEQRLVKFHELCASLFVETYESMSTLESY